MNTFARYAFRIFVWNFLILWVSFTALLQIFDLLNNSDEIFDRHPNNVDALFEYFVWRIPEIASFLIPFCTLMATLLSLGRLERYREIMALKAAGAPYNVVLRAFLPAVGLVAIAHFLIVDQAVPVSINHLLSKNLFVEKKVKDEDDDKRLWIQDGQTVVEVGRVERQGLDLYDIRLYRRDENGRLLEQIMAKKATFDVNKVQWTLDGASKVLLRPDRVDPVKELGTIKWETEIGPQEFSELIERPQAMTFKRLLSFATSAQIGVRPTYFYETWLQKRIALPVSSILMILLAAPVAHSLYRRDRSMAVGMAAGFGLGFLYFVIEGLVLSMGENGAIPPFFAAWLPALLFASIGGLALIRSEGY